MCELLMRIVKMSFWFSTISNKKYILYRVFFINKYNKKDIFFQPCVSKARKKNFIRALPGSCVRKKSCTSH